jgi:hypothetical protein
MKIPVDNLCLEIAKRLTPRNIWAEFQAIGMEFETNTTPYRVVSCGAVFREEKLRRSEEFVELWNITIHWNL